MNWHILSTPGQWQAVLEASFQTAQLVYKHSTRCAISSVVKSRLERAAAPENVTFHYLDLIAHRALSNQIAEDLRVEHESPQALLVRDGKCIFNESHMAISMDDISDNAK